MQGGTQSTNAGTGIVGSLQNIDNLTNFQEDYNDLGLNTNLETYSVKTELIRLANQKYKETDTKMLNEKIKDLEKTLEINKELIATLMQPKSEEKDNEVVQKLTDENTYLKKRLKQIYSDFEVVSSKLLVLEQINADFKCKEHVISR